jgi:LL-diaminopimelate aminotransferase
MMEFSKRLAHLPPYLFVEIDKAKNELKKKNADLIDFGIGDPDLPTPHHIVEALRRAAGDASNHRYALDQGMAVLRRQIASRMKRRFGVSLDPDTEILPLIGSKEGIAHFPFAALNVGDYVLVPQPSYPPYTNASLLAGGRIGVMPLLEKNDFLPDFTKIPLSIAKQAKLMFLNYPNNPTSATCQKGFFAEALRFAKKHDIFICHDAAYCDVYFGARRPQSIFACQGARAHAIEFHSLSKTYNMTGWRLGWACGNKEAVRALGKFKSNIDSGIFQAIQLAGVAALEENDRQIQRRNALYKRRRMLLVSSLKKLGMKVFDSSATFYVWARVPEGFSSAEYTKMLLEKAHIVATPGSGFGRYGSGYVRFSLTVDEDRIKKAVARIARLTK